MTTVTFYQLDESQDNGVDATISTASTIVANAYTNRKWALVLCNDQHQAEAVDEVLWQLPTDRFIPHNLMGEGPKNGTPVEISWLGQQLNKRHTLINVSQSMIENSQQYQNIVDFVPVDEQEKALARERYKQYQQAGCRMQYFPVSQLNESNESNNG